MLRIFLPFAAALLVAGCASQANVDDVVPLEQHAGIGSGTPVGTVDMAAHKLAGNTGDYELRARLLTIAPGSAAVPHPHAGQPGSVRVTRAPSSRAEATPDACSMRVTMDSKILIRPTGL